MTPSRDAQRAQVVSFLRGIQKAGRGVDTLADSDGLVASGLIDSLAVLQIVTWLEAEHGVDFATSGIDPEQLGTIGGIVDLMADGR